MHRTTVLLSLLAVSGICCAQALTLPPPPPEPLELPPPPEAERVQMPAGMDVTDVLRAGTPELDASDDKTEQKDGRDKGEVPLGERAAGGEAQPSRPADEQAAPEKTAEQDQKTAAPEQVKDKKQDNAKEKPAAKEKTPPVKRVRPEFVRKGRYVEPEQSELDRWRRQRQEEHRAQARKGKVKTPNLKGVNSESKIKLEKSVEFARHTFRTPSERFLEFYKPYAVRVGRVSLLKTTVEQLLKSNPECRIVPPPLKGKGTEHISCPNPVAFGADGDEVRFEFIPANDVLVSAELYFSDSLKARAYIKAITADLKRTTDLYLDQYGAVDSPMYEIVPFPAGRGIALRMTPHFQEETEKFESYARQNVEPIAFGPLTVGKTRREEISVPLTEKEFLAAEKAAGRVDPNFPPPKSPCFRTNMPDHRFIEVYGKCYGFPYRSHYQIELDKETGVLRSLVLTPLEITAPVVIENGLTARWGKPLQCAAATSNVPLLVSNKRTDVHSTPKPQAVGSRPVLVWAGNCQEPVIFAVEERYAFKYDRIAEETILDAYRQRKLLYSQANEFQGELNKHKSELDEFFK